MDVANDSRAAYITSYKARSTSRIGYNRVLSRFVGFIAYLLGYQRHLHTALISCATASNPSQRNISCNNDKSSRQRLRTEEKDLQSVDCRHCSVQFIAKVLVACLKSRPITWQYFSSFKGAAKETSPHTAGASGCPNLELPKLLTVILKKPI